MKTQYTALVKIKKQHLDKMENAVASCNDTIKILNTKINTSLMELRSLEMPQGGDFSFYRQAQLFKKRIQDDIAFNRHNLVLANDALMKAMQQLKTANIEFEKFKYLETLEIDKVLQKQKMLESKELDEVALMGYIRHAQN